MDAMDPSSNMSSSPEATSASTVFDLFLSYNSNDRELIQAVRQHLEARGVVTFMDHENLLPGLPWPEALEKAVSSVRAVAVFVSRTSGNGITPASGVLSRKYCVTLHPCIFRTSTSEA